MSVKDRLSKINNIEITPEMIEAGLQAWREAAGDQYPEHSITNDLTLIEVYCAMVKARWAGAP